ncbi:lysine--tRNA ligase [Marine Group I thaumarchaeote]|nr:lysine--tRNA ligase [Marine Group I thaumarchaeote]
MTEQKIIGKGTWIDKLAFELIEREKQLGRDIDGIIRVESGLGASGIPHIGSLGDAVRAYGVKLALENFGYKSELIAYSDDLDGLRKIPEGLDVKEENIGRRVSAIDDPLCDEHDSYGEHMSSLLLDGLNRLGIEYEHKTASQTYKEGLLTEQIHKILVNSKKIGGKIEELTGQEKFQNILPYFPVCKNCDRLYTTESFEYIEDEKKVRYRCKDSEIGSNIIKGCGHEGESDITKDLGKLAWKVEFAARWQAFDIRFEAYGKDIMDSVKVNDWVSDEILGLPHPHHVKYEMFLEKGGKKISKSLGNVVTSQKWLTYGTHESILLLLYKRITGARELGFEDIPALMDEYNELENIYFGKTKVDNEAKLVKSKGLYEYVNLLNPPKNSSTHVNYRLLIELCKIFKDHTVEHVVSKLINYGTIKEKNPHIEKLIGLAKQYSADFEETKIPATKIIVDDSAKDALRQLADLLSKNEKIEDLQNSIYRIAKENQVQPKDFFKILYQIILSTNRGPKIGPFIEDVGMKEVAEKIKRNL